MRAFLAFEINENDKNLIKKILNKNFKNLKKLKLLKENSKLKPVKEKYYHITFLFFENLSNENFRKISKIFKEKLIFMEIEIEIKGINYFTDKYQNVRVIFLELKENKEFNKIISIYKKVFKELDLNFNEVKQLNSLIPHITLFRLKKPVNVKALKEDFEILNNEFKNIKIKIESFCLFKSTLTRNGPIYEKLLEIKN
ncbi:MAG: RNA 2',3'-cyclic phosphodiesterase [Nanoarchaeota archaeon]